MITELRRKPFCIMLLITFASLFPTESMAQRWLLQQTSEDLTTISLKVAYMSTIKYPGFRLGFELPTVKKEYFKNEQLKRTKEQFLTSNFGFYHHPTFHSNYILSLGYLFRRTNSHNWFFDIEPQIGVNRTILGGTTYIVDNNGNVKQNKLAGYWYFNSQVAFSVGKDFSKQRKPIPIKAYVRPNLLFMLPYNNYFYLRPTIELGVIFRIQKLLSKKVSHKSFLRNLK